MLGLELGLGLGSGLDVGLGISADSGLGTVLGSGLSLWFGARLGVMLGSGLGSEIGVGPGFGLGLGAGTGTDIDGGMTESPVHRTAKTLSILSQAVLISSPPPSKVPKLLSHLDSCSSGTLLTSTPSILSKRLSCLPA